MTQRPWLTWAKWTLIKAIAFALIALLVINWTEGLSLGTGWGTQFPLLVAVFFVAFAAIALLFLPLFRAVDKWRFAEQWLVASGVAYIPVLIAMTIWPGWLDKMQVLHGPIFTAIILIGAVWAVVDWVRRRQRPDDHARR